MTTFIIILASVLILLFLCLFAIYYKAFYNSKWRIHITKYVDDEKGQYKEYKEQLKATTKAVAQEENFECVEIKSFDGITLYGRYYHYNDNAPTDIIFHGYRSSALHDCGGGFLLARELGHNVLLPDQRAHGKSGGCTITFGIKERYDCLAWCNYISERSCGAPIIISGVSMGASTVLMASELQLPKNVLGVIGDCGFSSPKEIILSECEKMGIAPRIAEPFIKLAARLFGGFNLEEADCMRAVKNTKLPILIVHGKEDGFVPCYMAEKIFEAATGDKKLLVVEKADHGMSFLVDAKAYRNEINDFKIRVLNNN